MLSHLADVSIRSIALAAIAALVLCFPRARRTAAFEHALWASVICGMLALFVFGAVLPRLPLPLLSGGVEVVGNPAPPITMPQAPTVISTPSPQARTVTPAIFSPLLLWGAVAFFLFARMFTALLLVRRLSKRSTDADSFCESDAINVPFTIGWLHPRILLPVAWREWSSEKLAAVLEHEGAHVRRRDGLIQLLAGVNRCIFWFHPLAWFAERRLALLAEQACDEACVATLGDRESYARLLVEMASVMDGSQGRLRYHALTMAAAPHLRKRVDALMQEGRTFSRGLGRAAWVTLGLAGIPLVLAAGVVELKKQPPLLQMELPRWSVPAPPTQAQPVLIAQAQLPAARPEPSAKFDSASIKPCADGDGAGRPGRGGAGGRGTVEDPGSLFVHCMSVREMIDIAVHDNGAIPPLINDEIMPLNAERVRGGPTWVSTALYTIDAHTADPVANEPRLPPGVVRSKGFQLMSGPMLLSLLESRFHLRIHPAVEQVPMYALSVAAGGLKLKPFENGNCIEIDRGVFPYPGGFKYGRDPKPPCNWFGWGSDGPNRTMDGGSIPLSRVAAALSAFFMDRHVIDETGLPGTFNVHLEFFPDEHTPMKVKGPDMMTDPASNIPKVPTIFTAIEQQLGLKLEETSGPKGYVVIDSAQRPDLN